MRGEGEGEGRRGREGEGREVKGGKTYNCTEHY